MVKKQYFGSADWTISDTIGQDLIADYKTSNGFTHLTTNEFDFYNLEECVIQVNGSTNILLAAKEGFNDKGVFSFKIMTANVTYKYQASY